MKTVIYAFAALGLAGLVAGCSSMNEDAVPPPTAGGEPGAYAAPSDAPAASAEEKES